MAGNELMELASRTFKPSCTVIIKPKRGAPVAKSFFYCKIFSCPLVTRKQKHFSAEKKKKQLAS